MSAAAAQSAQPHEISLAKISDLNAIISLEQNFDAQDRFSRRTWRRLLSGSNPVFVYMIGGKIAGVASFLLRRCAKVVRFYSLIVHPDYRGQGIAQSLIEYAAEYFRSEPEYQIMRLEVRQGNHGAIRLYERCGFFRSGLREGYYPDGEAALIYDLDLKVK